MPQEFNISRRKALAALGTIGVASAGAGVGTTAYFNDTESFENNSVQAGTLNLQASVDVIDYDFGGVNNTNVVASGNNVPFDTDEDTNPFGNVSNYPETTSKGAVVVDGDAAVGFQLGDVKPGDSFVLKVCANVLGNPAYVRTTASNVADPENDITEPEGDDDSSGNDYGTKDDGIDLEQSSPGDNDGISGDGELDNAIEVTVGGGYDSQAGEIDPSISRLSGSLNKVLNDLTDGGIDFRGGSSFTGVACYYAKFEIPDGVGNIIQGDSVSFDLEFEAAQARNNSSNPFDAVDS
ncbi:SipW-dependent-type signal peptide-containing protein [Salinirubrum litoreum]|uniref:SipW-dependent-type signal peptide-containing protein n=1 Tax=Salinirubrum litoreum TaxID=1126234 RepID=A0ABD5R8V5_9EURY|nr:SipW-dependent-type signal peptide-containing protein [Salinirubrum litoreum]